MPAANRAACRPVSTPSPPASRPIRRTAGVVDEAVEDAHGVGPAADAGDDGVGQPADEVEHLGAGLDADDPVEVAHHLGERVRAGDRAEEVVGGVDVGHPVAHGLVDRVLEGARCRW